MSRPIEVNEPQTTQTFTSSALTSIERIDLLLSIDNSSSMGDKQAILAQAVPDLVRGLLNPRCVDDAGKAVPDAQQPDDPLAACPVGTIREFTPVVDVHLGIISSSVNIQCGVDAGNDDGAHLITTEAEPGDGGKPFLNWDPRGQSMPAGEGDLGKFEDNVRTLVQGVGEKGCGFEAQLESWYRFLVEPAPPDPNDPKKIDTGLLKERDAFLRPDSLVAVIVLSDENDCSFIREGASNPLLDIRTGHHPAPARSVCKTNPDDECCAPCGEEAKGCPADPTCKVALTDETDPFNLRCFDQKRRFGRDHLYPVQRYVDALTKDTVVGLDGETKPNPLFPGSSAGLAGRSTGAGLVYFAGIVGVPWQDIARKNDQNAPDLRAGKDASGAAVGGFLNADEMNAKSGPWGSTWDLVLGDPAKRIKPADRLMFEAENPRDGESPIVKASLAPPESSSPTANPINGHEWNSALENGSDLQYACIFPLKDPFDCESTPLGCPCDPSFDNPLCQKDDGSYSTTQQLRAKAYPGTRQLEVIKGLGQQGIVGSICPAQITTPGPDFGYEPAVGAIIERLKNRLSTNCLPLKLRPQKDGTFPCTILEGHQTDEGCSCNSDGREPLKSDDPAQAAVDAIPTRNDYACFCKVTQLGGDERDACQNDPGLAPAVGGAAVNGWCYVDPVAGDGKNPDVVKLCPDSEKRELRFVGGGKPEPKTTTFVTCVD